jgi:hypothetical protein
MQGMGMNAMNMPPMAGGFGMQGMSGMDPNMMNMMGMMGMNGVNGMLGMGFNGGGFDGWNNMQQMNGGFGASGFFPNGGFDQSHQGQYPQMSQHQQYPKNNFHNQNRFQGSQRGYGRGYHNQGNGQFHNQTPIQASGPPPGAPKGPKAAQIFQGNSDAFHHQLPHKVQSRRSSQAMSVERGQDPVDHNTKVGETEKSNTALQSGQDSLDAQDPSDKEYGTGPAGNVDGELTKQTLDVDTGPLAQETALVAPTDHNEQPQLDDTQGPSAILKDGAPINGVDYSDNKPPVAPANNFQHNIHNQARDQAFQVAPGPNHAYLSRPAFRGRGSQDLRGGSFRGRGAPTWQYHGTHGPSQMEVKPLIPVEPLGTGVQGAPTGPKAMRDGLPNTGWSGRGRGGGRGGVIVPQSPVALASVSVSVPPTPRHEQ